MSILWGEESLLASLLKVRPNMVGSELKAKAAWRSTQGTSAGPGQWLGLGLGVLGT